MRKLILCAAAAAALAGTGASFAQVLCGSANTPQCPDPRTAPYDYTGMLPPAHHPYQNQYSSPALQAQQQQWLAWQRAWGPYAGWQARPDDYRYDRRRDLDRGAYRGRRDRDGDGVPNRRDRYPDHPYYW